LTSKEFVHYAYVLPGEDYRKHCEECGNFINVIFHGDKRTDTVTVFCKITGCEVQVKAGYFKPVPEEE